MHKKMGWELLSAVAEVARETVWIMLVKLEEEQAILNHKPDPSRELVTMGLEVPPGEMLTILFQVRQKWIS